jgi:hypothetical protein
LATPFFNFFALFSRFGLFTSFLRGTRISFDVMDATKKRPCVWAAQALSAFSVLYKEILIPYKKGRAARMWAALPSLGLLYWISRRSTRANFHKKKPTNRCGLDKSRRAPLL